MKFLADQDVWKTTVDLLRAWGHDVSTAIESGLSRASDEEMLTKAGSEGRLLITRDRDFGSLVFLGSIPARGVILLRIMPQTQDEVHIELQRLLAVHKEDELRKSFCTVEPGRHRTRKIPES
jgi:predicted nuclease of predicted toxin-antitoxin system